MKFFLYLIFILIILVVFKLNTIKLKFIKQQRIFRLCQVILALLMILFLWNISDCPWLFSDFNKAYYPAGHRIIQNPLGLYEQDKWGFEFVNIPIIAIVFTPFSFFSLNVAQVLLAILSGLAVFTACYFLLKLTKVSNDKQLALIGLFVINGPLYYSLREGNVTHFVLLLLIAGLFAIQAKREILLGIILAIAALLKIPLFLLGIYFAMRGRMRVIAGFGFTLLAIVGASLLLFGLDLHLTWYHECIQPFTSKPLSAYNVQSVDSFLVRLLYYTNGKLTNWLPIEVGWDFKIIRYALLSLLVGTTIWVCWRSKPPRTLAEENLEFCIVLCLALVTSAISWSHYYLFLLLPFALYLGNSLAIPKGRLWSSSLVGSILLASLPVIFIKPTAIPILNFLYPRLLISHYFFGGVLLLAVLLTARWQTSKRSALSLAQEPYIVIKN